MKVIKIIQIISIILSSIVLLVLCSSFGGFFVAVFMFPLFISELLLLSFIKCLIKHRNNAIKNVCVAGIGLIVSCLIFSIIFIIYTSNHSDFVNVYLGGSYLSALLSSVMRFVVLVLSKKHSDGNQSPHS